jgi:hypothetical protein
MKNIRDYSLLGVESKLAIEKGLAEAQWYTSTGYNNLVLFNFRFRIPCLFVVGKLVCNIPIPVL